jgi:hypothetical protein
MMLKARGLDSHVESRRLDDDAEAGAPCAVSLSRPVWTIVAASTGLDGRAEVHLSR